MAETEVDVLLVSVGSDLPYLVGYHAMPLERLTMLVVPRDGDATLVVPRMEAPRVEPLPEVFTLRAWNETDDPVAIVAELVGVPKVAAVGDTMWARFLVDLLAHWPSDRTRYVRSTTVMNALRTRKDAAEIAALVAAGAAVDRIAAQLQAGDIPLVGRTEAQVSADLGQRIIAEGHDVVNFAIVAAGENAASPHHEPGSRVIRADEMVLCDFGGTMAGYCSDITRCVYTGAIPSHIAEAYEVLHAAQAAGVAAGVVGAACHEVDRAARRIITDAGYGERFIHRTGHGIGMEAHEDPYMVEGNDQPIEAGYAFSVEPGIYTAGEWGMRLEDIVVATVDGPLAVNTVHHGLVALG
jgi:Xaa-Pro aminopeptidase